MNIWCHSKKKKKRNQTKKPKQIMWGKLPVAVQNTWSDGLHWPWIFSSTWNYSLILRAYITATISKKFSFQLAKRVFPGRQWPGLGYSCFCHFSFRLQWFSIRYKWSYCFRAYRNAAAKEGYISFQLCNPKEIYQTCPSGFFLPFHRLPKEVQGPDSVLPDTP